jgi:hypothetical protein
LSVEQKGIDSMSEPCLERMNDMEQAGKICDSDECFQLGCLILGSGFSFFVSNKLVVMNNLSFDYWISYLYQLEPSIPSQVYRPPTA